MRQHQKSNQCKALNHCINGFGGHYHGWWLSWSTTFIFPLGTPTDLSYSKTFSFKLYKLLILHNMDYFWEYNSVWKSEWNSKYSARLPVGSAPGLSWHGHCFGLGISLYPGLGTDTDELWTVHSLTDRTPGLTDCTLVPGSIEFSSVYLEYFESWRKSLDLNKIHMFPVLKACRLQKRNGRTVIFWFRTCHQIKR